MVEKVSDIAARYRRGFDAYRSTNRTDVTGWLAQAAMDGDARKLAAVWLEENPADDDEPITAGWIASVGFEKVGGQWWPPDAQELGVPCLSWVERNGHLTLPGFHTIQNPTRRHVRRLCWVLGIDLLHGEQDIGEAK